MDKELTEKNKFRFNKKQVIISGIVMVAIVVLFFVTVFAIFKISKTQGRFAASSGTVNYKYAELSHGMSRDEIIDKYGQFDIVIDNHAAGYSVLPIEAGYKTAKPTYLMIYFDENDKMLHAYQEVWLND